MAQNDEYDNAVGTMFGRIIALELIIHELLKASDLKDQILRDCEAAISRMEATPDADDMSVAYKSARARLNAFRTER